MDLVVGETAPVYVRDAERADDRAAHDQGHRARRSVVGFDDPGLHLGGQGDVGLGEDVGRGHHPPLHDRPAGRPRAGRERGADREAGDDGPGGGDRDERARRGIQPEEDRGAGPEQPHDALDRSLGHRGRIEGGGELTGQRGEGRDALGLAPRRIRLPERTDVAIDTPDEAEQPVLRVRADRGREPDQDDGGRHRADAHAREVLQEDLVGGDHHRGEDDVPGAQGERGEHDEQDVDPDRESGHSARIAGRERRPLQEEDDGRVEEGDRHAGGEHDALGPPADQEDHGGGDPVEREEGEVAGPRGQPEQAAEDQEQQEECGDTPEANRVAAPGVLEAFARQLALERIRGALNLLHDSSIAPAAARLPSVGWGRFSDRLRRGSAPTRTSTSTGRTREACAHGRRVG